MPAAQLDLQRQKPAFVCRTARAAHAARVALAALAAQATVLKKQVDAVPHHRMQKRHANLQRIMAGSHNSDSVRRNNSVSSASLNGFCVVHWLVRTNGRAGAMVVHGVAQRAEHLRAPSVLVDRNPAHGTLVRVGGNQPKTVERLLHADVLGGIRNRLAALNAVHSPAARAWHCVARRILKIDQPAARVARTCNGDGHTAGRAGLASAVRIVLPTRGSKLVLANRTGKSGSHCDDVIALLLGHTLRALQPPTNVRQRAYHKGRV